jgi:hypothetical protein
LQCYTRNYSPEQHQQQYQQQYQQQQQQQQQQQHGETNSNGVEPSGHCESKMYTSTLTIRTQSNGHGLDCNRNPTNDHLNNTDNKLHKLTDGIRDFALEQQQRGYELDERDYCSKSAYSRAFKVTIETPPNDVGDNGPGQVLSSDEVIDGESRASVPRPTRKLYCRTRFTLLTNIPFTIAANRLFLLRPQLSITELLARS